MPRFINSYYRFHLGNIYEKVILEFVTLLSLQILYSSYHLIPGHSMCTMVLTFLCIRII